MAKEVSDNGAILARVFDTHQIGEAMPAEQQVRVSVRMPFALADKLERMAAEEDRTLSAELRRLIRRHVETAERKEAVA
jgi:hypothetical protein